MHDHWTSRATLFLFSYHTLSATAAIANFHDQHALHEASITPYARSTPILSSTLVETMFVPIPTLMWKRQDSSDTDDQTTITRRTSETETASSPPSSSESSSSDRSSHSSAAESSSSTSSSSTTSQSSSSSSSSPSSSSSIDTSSSTSASASASSSSSADDSSNSGLGIGAIVGIAIAGAFAAFAASIILSVIRRRRHAARKRPRGSVYNSDTLFSSQGNRTMESATHTPLLPLHSQDNDDVPQSVQKRGTLAGLDDDHDGQPGQHEALDNVAIAPSEPSWLGHETFPSPYEDHQTQPNPAPHPPALYPGYPPPR